MQLFRAPVICSLVITREIPKLDGYCQLFWLAERFKATALLSHASISELEILCSFAVFPGETPSCSRAERHQVRADSPHLCKCARGRINVEAAHRFGSREAPGIGSPSSCAARCSRSNVDSRTLVGSRYARVIAPSEMPELATIIRPRSNGLGTCVFDRISNPPRRQLHT